MDVHPEAAVLAVYPLFRQSLTQTAITISLPRLRQTRPISARPAAELLISNKALNAVISTPTPVEEPPTMRQ